MKELQEASGLPVPASLKYDSPTGTVMNSELSDTEVKVVDEANDFLPTHRPSLTVVLFRHIIYVCS